MMNHNASILQVLQAMQSCLTQIQVYIEPGLNHHQEAVLEDCQVQVAVTLEALRQEIEQANQEAVLNNPVI